ncbi:asparagine-rich antigen, putative [Plasmodium malariae]|uniref:histone acetyltransferase n=1 Tax=Plasmodium malariae TaxID=5858 RepID=A0A1A8WC89_PLAMA|nr:asparagine-rich antigen, putative [Plasmodium malariae]SBS90629.1 asparagine-rich antigen, putative [Plasmodium malariae]SCP03413.1 asparagine-rich antigen, putative [Plasmodium malariae]
MDRYNEDKNDINLNFLNSLKRGDENVHSRNKKSNFIEFQYDKVVNNVLGLFKKQKKQRFLSTSSALRNDMHEQILSSRLFLDLREDREILLHKILKKINILNLIYFRFLKDVDIEDVFDLHKELFPVKYHADFYFSICNFDDNKIIDDDIIKITDKISNSLRNNVNNKRYSSCSNNYNCNDTVSKGINNNRSFHGNINGNCNNTSNNSNGSNNEMNQSYHNIDYPPSNYDYTNIRDHLNNRSYHNSRGNDLNDSDHINIKGEIKNLINSNSADNYIHRIKVNKVEETKALNEHSDYNDDDMDNDLNKKFMNSEECNSLTNSVDMDIGGEKKINKKWKEEEIFSLGAFLPFSFIDYVNSDYITKMVRNKPIENITEKEILLDYIKFIDDTNSRINKNKRSNNSHVKYNDYENGSFKNIPKNNLYHMEKDNLINERKNENFINSTNYKENENLNTQKCTKIASSNVDSIANGDKCNYLEMKLKGNINNEDNLKKEKMNLFINGSRTFGNNNCYNNDLLKKDYKKEDNIGKYESTGYCRENEEKNNYNYCDKENLFISDKKQNNRSNYDDVRDYINEYLNKYQGSNNEIYNNNNSNIHDIYNQLKEKSIIYEERNGTDQDKRTNGVKENMCLNKETLLLYNPIKKNKIKKDYLIGSISTLINYQDVKNEKDFINIYNHFRKKSNNLKKEKNYLKYMYDTSINFLDNYIPLDKNVNNNGKDKNNMYTCNNCKINQRVEKEHRNTEAKINDKKEAIKSSTFNFITNNDHINNCWDNSLEGKKKEKLLSVNNVLGDLNILKIQNINKDIYFEKKLYEEIYMNENIKDITKKYIKKKINSVYILTVGISEYFRGLNLASYLIDYTLFYFYFIIYRIFLYNNKIYCYIDNDAFYSLSNNLKDECTTNDTFDEGILSDSSMDELCTILNDEKVLSDIEMKHHRFCQYGKDMEEEKLHRKMEKVQRENLKSREYNKMCEKTNGNKENELIKQMGHVLGNHCDIINTNLYNNMTNGVDITKGVRSKEETLGNISPCDISGEATKDHYKLQNTNFCTIQRDDLKNMNNSTNNGNKCKNKRNRERSKNYSICNGVIGACYKQIILNDYLHYLYDIIHNKNSEIITNGEIPKKKKISYIVNFPPYNNPRYCSGINSKILDFFLNNFCAHNLKDRPFFYLRNVKTKRSHIYNNDEDASIPLYIYLHVIDYNKAAINLYNKLNFDYIYTYENFYDINKITFSSYLYAYFF